MNANDELGARFAETHPEDAARVLERARPEDTAAFLTGIPVAAATSVVRQMNTSLAAVVLSALEASRGAAIIEDLPLSQAASLLRQMDHARVEALLTSVSEKVARALRGVLRYQEGSAGALADPQVLTLPSDISAGDAQKHLRRLAGDVAYNVYVTDRNQRLVGVVTVRELLLARPKQTLESIMIRQPIRLAADSDLTSIAANPAWEQFDMLPVVDGSEVLLGAIHHRTIRQLERARAKSLGYVNIFNVALSIADMYWTTLSILAADLSIAGTSQARSAAQSELETTR